MWRERCGSSGVAAAADGSSWAEPAAGMINQGVARAFARVRRPGLLTFAAVSEVGVSGRRVGAWRAFFEFTMGLQEYHSQVFRQADRLGSY